MHSCVCARVTHSNNPRKNEACRGELFTENLGLSLFFSFFLMLKTLQYPFFFHLSLPPVASLHPLSHVQSETWDVHASHYNSFFVVAFLFFSSFCLSCVFASCVHHRLVRVHSSLSVCVCVCMSCFSTVLFYLLLLLALIIFFTQLKLPATTAKSNVIHFETEVYSAVLYTRFMQQQKSKKAHFLFLLPTQALVCLFASCVFLPPCLFFFVSQWGLTFSSSFFFLLFTFVFAYMTTTFFLWTSLVYLRAFRVFFSFLLLLTRALFCCCVACFFFVCFLFPFPFFLCLLIAGCLSLFSIHTHTHTCTRCVVSYLLWRGLCWSEGVQT